MIDKEKKYTTRDGLEVRIYCTDGGGDYPVHGAMKLKNGTWYACQWRPHGRYHPDTESPLDLVEAKPRITGWVNIYDDGCGLILSSRLIHSSREDADKVGRPGRIACIEIDVPHGYGLEGK